MSRHANLEQRRDGLAKVKDILAWLGAAMTAVALSILVIIAVIQNARLENLTEALKSQQDYIELQVTQSNRRGSRTVEIIDAICRATVPEKDQQLCKRER